MMRNRVYVGDVLDFAQSLQPQSIQCMVTSPPYFNLRRYLPAAHPDKAREIGGEATPAAFVAALVAVFRALRPALRDDGTLWLNLGDAYANDTKWGGVTGGKHAAGVHGQTGIGRARCATGLPSKCLLGIPWRVAFALIDDGWVLRSDIVWHKPNAMPESVKDRPTRSHEYIFLLTKGPRYYYDASAIAESAGSPPRTLTPRRADSAAFGCAADRGSFPPDGRISIPHKQDGHGRRHDGFNARYDFANPTPTRNKRDVWTVPTAPSGIADHFATFPPALIRPCILAGSRLGDVVADPFNGSGTTCQVAVEEGRHWIACDIDERSVRWTADRLARVQTRLVERATVSSEGTPEATGSPVRAGSGDDG